MDFPLSVPSIGLVGGQFADEDPLAGSPGSLIPSKWGNSVTLEILNVIKAAGLLPDEEDNTQLLAAIESIAGGAVSAATEAVAGKAKLASQPEAEAGADNAKIMTALRVAQQVAKRIATQPQVTAGTDDATFITPLKLATRLAAGAAPVGAARNVKMSVAAASVSAPLTADEVIVKSGLGGAAWLVSTLNKTIDLSKTGAGGMDTGAAPVSGFVSIYAIYNPTTGASALLACAQATSNGNIYTGANMPAGYTASALVSSWPTTAAGLLGIGGQRDRIVSRPAAQISSTNASAAPIPIAPGAPLNAVEISGYANTISGVAQGGVFYLASDASGSGAQSIGTSGTGVGCMMPFTVPVVTPGTVYLTSANNTTANAYITSYKF